MQKPQSKSRPWQAKQKTSKPMEDRKKSNAFYHTNRWKIESRLFREENPCCKDCEAEGIIYPAEVTDHEIPFEICEDPWDKANWSPRCKRHNNLKGAKDKKLIQQYKKTHNNETVR